MFEDCWFSMWICSYVQWHVQPQSNATAEKNIRASITGEESPSLEMPLLTRKAFSDLIKSPETRSSGLKLDEDEQTSVLCFIFTESKVHQMHSDADVIMGVFQI